MKGEPYQDQCGNWWIDAGVDAPVQITYGDRQTKKIYLIGSLRNPEVPVTAAHLRSKGFEVFDDWFAAGPEADDWWKKYEQARGRTYKEALNGYAANHVFHYDLSHLDSSDIGVLILPAGRSGHLELGYLSGQRKPVAILLENESERFDVMYKFATVCHDMSELEQWLESVK